jgi:mono/diheme cytochrome c family protein
MKCAPRYACAALGLALSAAACRGQVSEDPPVIFFDNMYVQPKLKAQNPSPTFSDGRGMRPLEEGTVAVGQLRDDDARYRGKEGDAYVTRAPIQVDEGTLRRGQERFNIYCTPCHDRSGGGQGTVVRRGYPPPVDLASDRVRTMPDGQIFDTITNGVRNMPSYRKQIPVDDRWAIVTWVRVLGHSQHASLADVPPEQRDHIEAENGTP